MTAVAQTKPITIAAAEKQAREELAAAHRIAGVFGWTNLIFNHITLRVPGEPEHFLMKQDAEMFEEVTASSLVKLDMKGTILDKPDAIVSPGFDFHVAILQARPDVNCIAHVHTEAGMAMSAHRVGLRPINQDAMHFYNRIGYNTYDGLAGEIDSRDALLADLGTKWALVMRNHGVLTCAENCGVTLLLMKYLISACKTQLMLEASGAEVLIPSPETCEAVAARWERNYRKSHAAREWAAMLRLLEPIDSDYRR